MKHDVIAFLTHVTEIVGPEARFLHQGMTSSDVNDTALAVQLSRATDLLIEDVDLVLAALKRRAFEHKLHPDRRPQPRHPRRAHHLRPEARRPLRRVRARQASGWRWPGSRSPPAPSPARSAPSPTSIRAVEAYVADKLGLAVEPVSTQVIPRDRHAAYFAALAVVASSIERLAIEIRHLQRTEVLEAEEPFDPGQKGSSAMPHKRNPILTENLTGLARLVRSAVVPALENVTLWHERDISHSSVERGIAPDATVHLDFALRRLASVVERLVIYPENMAEEPRPPGRPGALPARAAGPDPEGRQPRGRLRRGPAQRHEGLARRGQFPRLPEGRPGRAPALSDAELAELFDLGYHFKNVDTLFTRVFGQQEPVMAMTGK